MVFDSLCTRSTVGKMTQTPSVLDKIASPAISDSGMRDNGRNFVEDARAPLLRFSTAESGEEIRPEILAMIDDLSDRSANERVEAEIVASRGTDGDGETGRGSRTGRIER